MFLTAIGWLPFLINSSGLFLIMTAIIMQHLTPRELFYSRRTDRQGDLSHTSMLTSEEEEGIILHMQNGSHGSQGQPETRPPRVPFFLFLRCSVAESVGSGLVCTSLVM